MSTTLPETVVTATRLPPEPAPPVPRGPPRLTHKRIDITFIKGPKQNPGVFAASPTFAESNTDAIKLSGLRCSAHITKAGGLSKGSLQLRVWGMTPSTMNDLSTLGLTINIDRQVLNNQVIVEAGDDEAGMSVVYYGTLWDEGKDVENHQWDRGRTCLSSSLTESVGGLTILPHGRTYPLSGRTCPCSGLTEPAGGLTDIIGCRTDG